MRQSSFIGVQPPSPAMDAYGSPPPPPSLSLSLSLCSQEWFKRSLF